MKIFKWLLVLCLSFAILSTNRVYSQQNNTSIDGLLKLLDRPDDSVKVVALKLLCWEYRNVDTVFALKYGKEAVALAQKLEMKHELADIYNRLGVVRRNQGKYSHALDNYFKGIEISKTNNYQKLLAFAYNNVADIYNRLGIYDKALEFGKSGLEISSKLNDDYTLSYVYNILGVIYKNSKDLDSSLLCFNHSLDLRRKNNFTSGIATSLLNIGSVQFLKGQYDSCYLNTTKAIDIYNEKNDKTGLAGAYKYLGLYYNQLKEYKKAIRYFNECLALNEKFGDLQIEKEVNEGLNYSYAQLGDIKKAYYYKNLSCRMGDSITINLFVERITYLTENYKFELEKQAENLLRNERESSLNNKIKYQRSVIKLYIFILLLLGALVFVVILNYQQKNKDIKTLKRQKKEIDELNSTKDKLFSILAHDLKNPISSVIGISELLKNDKIPLTKEKQQQLLMNLYNVGKSANAILDEVLNWAKTQTNQINILSEDIRLKDLANGVVANQQAIATNKSITITNSIDSEIVVNTDSYIVSTVLRNLLSNAIKYSKAGGIIDISVEEILDFYNVSIRDNGVGMSDEQKKSIFSLTNIHSSYGTANESGTGLGLIICTEFIAKIGGKIWVESNVGEGSTFTFSIPKRKNS